MKKQSEAAIFFHSKHTFLIVDFEFLKGIMDRATVQNGLNRGIYVATTARNTCSRPLFRSHTTIYKIYEVEGGAEVPNWYRCVRCQDLIFCIARNGTKPLNSHAEVKCASITEEERLAARAARFGIQSEDQASGVVDAAQQQVIRAAPAVESAAPAQDVACVVTADDLAAAFSRATRLGAVYGVVSASTFRRFLNEEQPW